MKRGFSVSTAILVALLLGVLVMVGKVVNPPSANSGHDHGEEPEQSQTPGKPPMTKEEQAAMTKQQQDRMRDEMRKHQPRNSGQAASAPKKDALNASAWQEHDMGAVTPKPDPAPMVITPKAAPAAPVLNVTK